MKNLKKACIFFLVLMLASAPALKIYAEPDSSEESSSEESSETPSDESSESSETPSSETSSETAPSSQTAPQPTEPSSTATETTEAETTETTTEEETESEGNDLEPLPLNENLYGPDVFAETYCVIDGDTGEVLFSKDKDRLMYPASCTKMITALIVLERVQDLDQKLTFTRSAIDIDPSSSTLDPKAMVGETMTVRDALYGMLLKSANECGAMLGEFVGGSEKEFAQIMNEKAAEIGCKNTHFTNAYGIHNDDHYTTAYDLALILRACMENERYRELNGTVNYTIPQTNMCGPRTFNIGHAMLNGSFDEEGVIGGKTGSTPQAGRCLATACRRNGRYMITTVMKSSVENYYGDTSVLLEYTDGVYNLHSMAPMEWVTTDDLVTPTDNVRVRFSPSMKGAIAGMAFTNTQYLRRGIYGDWSMVQYDGKLLYILSSYLQSDEPEKVPVTEAYVYEEPTESTQESGEDTSGQNSTEETGEKETHKGMIPIDESESEEAEEKKGNRNIWQILLIVCPAVFIAALLTLWVIFLVNHARNVKKAKKRRIHGKKRKKGQKKY